MKVYATHKKILSIQTKDPSRFLTGLTSNDMSRPDNAFLNIHARIVATFDQIQINEEQYLLCIEAPYIPKVLSHIDRFVKLGGVKAEVPNFNVYFDLDSDASLQHGDHTIPQKQGRLIITKRVLDAKVFEEAFTLFRLRHHIPLLGVDYTDEMILNVSTAMFVSFTKGCFLGQEPVSKVYNRSKPTWRLEVKGEDQCNEEEKVKMTSKTWDLDRQQYIGFVFVKNG